MKLQPLAYRILEMGKNNHFKYVQKIEKYNTEQLAEGSSVLKFGVHTRSFQMEASKTVFFVSQGEFIASTYPGEIKIKLKHGDALVLSNYDDSIPVPSRLVLFEPQLPHSELIASEQSDS